jgi:hypothetical protein
MVGVLNVNWSGAGLILCTISAFAIEGPRINMSIPRPKFEPGTFRIQVKRYRLCQLAGSYYSWFSEMVMNNFSLSLSLSLCDSTALVDLGRFFSFLTYTQPIGLLGRGISPSQGRYLHTEQHKHKINAYRHPCLEWDSNPRFQCSVGRRRFMP